MRSAYADSVLVIFHYRTQKLGSVYKANTLFLCKHNFGIIGFCRRRIYNKRCLIYAVLVNGTVTVHNIRTHIFKLFGYSALIPVRTGNTVAVFKHNLCQTAHTYSAYTDKMYICRLIYIRHLKSIHHISPRISY